MLSRTAVVMAALLAAMALAACGSDDEQAEVIREERRDAAQSARQDERIKQLQREVEGLKDGGSKPVDTPPATTTTAPPPDTDASSDGGAGDWPGGSGHTAILASVSDEAEARSIQSQATSSGLDAGVLYSSDYRSLRPGYWVVFSGAFDSQAGAADRANRAKSLGYSDAYPRFVSP